MLRLTSNRHSGRNAPAFHCDTASIGLLTVELTCLPTSCTATGVGNVGELLRRRQLLERHRDDLVLLLGAGAAHLEGLVIAGLHCLDVVLRRLVGRLRVHPEDE